MKSGYNFTTNADYILQAFLTKNSDAISKLFSKIFSTIAYYERPKDEKTFHAIVHAILLAMNFNVQSKLTGADGRMDICFELQNGVYVVVKLKYCHEQLSVTEINKIDALYNVAKMNFSKEQINHALAQGVSNKLRDDEIAELTSKLPIITSTPADIDRLLSEEAENALTEIERRQALAEAAKKELDPEFIKTVLKKSRSKSNPDPNLDLDEKRVDDILSRAVQEALSDIVARGYHGIIGLKAKEIIDLGLAVYGNGVKVKAAFSDKSRKSKKS
jgi:hypothetical protein